MWFDDERPTWRAIKASSSGPSEILLRLDSAPGRRVILAKPSISCMHSTPTSHTPTNFSGTAGQPSASYLMQSTFPESGLNVYERTCKFVRKLNKGLIRCNQNFCLWPQYHILLFSRDAHAMPSPCLIKGQSHCVVLNFQHKVPCLKAVWLDWWPRVLNK